MKMWIFGVAALVAAMCFGATTEDGVTKERRGALGPNDTVVTDVDTTGIVAARTYTKDEIDRRIATNAPVRSVNGRTGRVILGASDVGALPNNRDDLKASANFRNAVWDVQIRGGGIDTNTVDALANSAVVTNALTVATTNRVALLESSKADKTALDTHVTNTNNPHAVTAAQVGAVPLVDDVHGNKTAVTIGSRKDGQKVGDYSLANGSRAIASGKYSHAEGMNTTAVGLASHAEGTATKAFALGSHADGLGAEAQYPDDYAYVWNGDDLIIDSYTSHGPGTFNINPAGGLNGFWIGEQTLAEILANKADKADISSTNPTFSNAVLSVGLNIDTNSVAVLNEIAETFGGFPIEGTATTVGGLLAALAAAVAWLKKNKVQTLKLDDGSVETSAENGVAKLDDFFTESNSLLNGRLAYSRNATGLKDRAFNALTFDGTEYNLSTALAAVTPTASGQPRDLLIVATATAATTISFTAGTIKGDKPTIDGSGTWLITLTEYASGVWYCRQIKMEDAA